MIPPVNGVPQHQLRSFKCPECGDGVFQILMGTVKFVFDALDPEKLQPVPTKMVQCLGCFGFLVHTKDGFQIVHKGQDEVGEGERWKDAP